MYHPKVKSVTQDIVASISDVSHYVVRTACRVATSLKIDDAREPIMKLLNSKEELTQEQALISLTQLWLPSAFDLILDIFKHSPQRDIRNHAGFALYNNRCEETWRILFNLFLSDPLHIRRVWACNLAAEFGDSATKNLIQGLVKDECRDVRKAARKVLGISCKSG
jgi:HEAT repeat protein